MHQRVHRSGIPVLQKQISPSAPLPSAVQTRREVGEDAFQRDKFESLGLQVKEKHGTITPVEQERLGVLQAKMKDFWTLRQEGARFGYHFAGVSGTDLSADGGGGGPQASPVIQRQVKTFLGQEGKIYYYSSYQQALESENHELFETREEAQEADAKYKQIWDSRKGPQFEEEEISTQKAKPSSKNDEEEEKEEKITSQSSEHIGASSSSSQHVGTSSKPVVQELRQGLVKGTYKEHENEADLHVDPDSGKGLKLTAKDMLAVIQSLNSSMRERREAGGPLGSIHLHPQGAGITKIIVELLGEALGGFFNKNIARAQKAYRGKIDAGKQSNKMDPRVLPEHFSYLDSLRGENKVSIVPEIFTQTKKYKPTSFEDFTQDMMVKTQAGKAKYEKYKGFLQDKNEVINEEGMTGVSLTIMLRADQFPAIIKLLKEQAAKEDQKK